MMLANDVVKGILHEGMQSALVYFPLTLIIRAHVNMDSIIMNICRIDKLGKLRSHPSSHCLYSKTYVLA